MCYQFLFRKRKQDTPNESRSTKAIKNQRPINAYFDLENRTPSRRNNENNGVSVRQSTFITTFYSNFHFQNFIFSEIYWAMICRMMAVWLLSNRVITRRAQTEKDELDRAQLLVTRTLKQIWPALNWNASNRDRFVIPQLENSRKNKRW